MPKCGSYFLRDLLNQHPRIEMDSIKEPGYFLDNKESSVPSFVSTKARNYFGEATVEYLINEKALYRIKKECVAPKFIILVRDPVKRAISHYFHRKHTDRRNFKTLKNSTNKEYWVEYSSYSVHIERFTKLFNQDQFMIVVSEDLYRNPQEVLNRIFSFLGLNSFDVDMAKVNINKGSYVKSRNFATFMFKSRLFLRRKTPFLSKLKLGKYWTFLTNLNVNNQKPKVPNQVYHYLENELDCERIYMRQKLGRTDIWLD